MAMVLTFHQTSIDTNHVKRIDRSWRAPFFDARHYLDSSTRVTDLSEQQIVRWILLCEPARRLLFNQLGFPASAFYEPEVIEPFFDRGKGDLDLVLCTPHRPQETTAVELKRVKVTVLDTENDQLNKLHDTREGVGQANRLYNKFGFFQSYLGIVSAIDASRQSHERILTG
jgi:hypothetical protein